jgi:hypothetical protein
MGCQFSLGDYSFQHDLRVLPLDSYDLILGMDWLKLFSLTEVHWKAKWLSLPFNGTTVLLQGLTSSSNEDMIFQLLVVEDTEAAVPSAELPLLCLLCRPPYHRSVPVITPSHSSAVQLR